MPTTQTTPAPLAPMLMAPTLLEKVWGGRRLEKLGKRMPHGKQIGESWELADLASTSAGGAGGQSVRTVIAAGPGAGRSLHDAVQSNPAGILGERLVGRGGQRDFPLLVKFLDATQNLSVQVHPSPAYLAANPASAAHLKTESWYVLDADPGAVLYIGLKPGITLDRFAALVRSTNGQSPEIAQMLEQVPAIPGECHTLPSGTVHALGAGVTVAEVQTPSDTTFRLYDWGRTAKAGAGRELHIEPALASMADPTIAAPDRAAIAPDALCGRLATTAYYTIDEARPLDGDELSIGYTCACKATGAKLAPGPFVLIVLAGSGQLMHAEHTFESVAVAMGQTWLVPAAAAARTSLRSARGLRVLRIGL